MSWQACWQAIKQHIDSLANGESLSAIKSLYKNGFPFDQDIPLDQSGWSRLVPPGLEVEAIIADPTSALLFKPPSEKTLEESLKLVDAILGPGKSQFKPDLGKSGLNYTHHHEEPKEWSAARHGFLEMIRPNPRPQIIVKAEETTAAFDGRLHSWRTKVEQHWL